MILSLRDRWAYDIAKNIIKDGELWDEDVISQSIEMIIATIFGERLFNPFFGSSLHALLFEGLDEKIGEKVLDSIISAIKRWEDRVTVIENKVELIISADGHSMVLIIPYTINKLNIINTFKKKILL